MRTKVGICLPSADSNNRIEITSLLCDLMVRQFTVPDYPYLFKFIPEQEARPVEFARNRLVSKFLKTDCDVLWFIDADGIPGAGMENVLRGNYDVSIGPVPMLIVTGAKNVVVCPNLFQGIDDGNVGELWDGESPIKAGGTANMAIKRHVLEDKRLHLDEDGSVFQRKYDTRGCPEFGEDADLCRRVLDLGYTLGAELDADCDHAKTYGLRWLMDVFQGMQERAREENDRRSEGQRI